MKINNVGLEIIKHFEGLELEAYPDPGSPLGQACKAKKIPMRSYTRLGGWNRLDGAPWTIGYGHTLQVKPGMKITNEQAEVFLKQDVSASERGVLHWVKVPINPNQFSALVCFCYNVGVYEFRTSTLLQRVNALRFTEAADEFNRWIYANDIQLPGLIRRRKSERALFLTPHYVLQNDIPGE